MTGAFLASRRISGIEVRSASVAHYSRTGRSIIAAKRRRVNEEGEAKPRGRHSEPTPARYKGEQGDGGISKVALALGAASLFLFVIGLKRTFRTDEGREIHREEADRQP